MARALATGLPQHAILNAARVARDREAAKRKEQQQQNAIETAQAQALVRQRQIIQQQQKRAISVAAASRPVPAPAPRPAPAPAPVSAVASIKSSIVSSNTADERNNWRRVQSGVFMNQKGRFGALPFTVGAISRTKDIRAVLPVSRKRPRSELILKAAMIQKQMKQSSADEPKTVEVEVDEMTFDPERFKRIKMEPKRVGKALDRALRKARQATAEGLIKQQKELSKAISSHQTDFFKYHRQRRAEASRLAKAVRDSLDKEGKKKEKEADQAERARLAALRSNDMAAYSKLLEETKNERLKFLLDKTDDCIRQITTSLRQRSIENEETAEFASASAAKAGSYYASAHLKTEDVRQPSILVGGDLKEYQIAGLQWMVSLYNNKLNGILADEMGLGKTIQAIALVSYLMEFKDNLGPYLVIVPLSTMSNWVNEFHKWCPSAGLVVYKGTPAQRKDLFKNQVRNGQFNVLLTTYEYIIRDKSSLRKIEWQYAIVDEGHRMKNAQSKFAVTLGTQYSTQNRILLTGTPLQNSLPELWALLNFLLPTIFASVESFDQWFNRPFAQFGNSGSDESTDQMLTNEERMLIIHRLHELLRPFMLRRVKSEVLDQLPEKVEKVIRCDLSSWQKELYKQISVKAVADKSLLGTGLEPPAQTSRGMNNVVMQLRKVCNHPYLFSPEGYHINENLIRSSGKFELLDRMLPKLKAAGHRVLMFTQMTAVMTMLEDYFAYRGYSSLRLDGSTPAEEREKRMYKFNAPDSPYFIFCLSTRAGGLGLNLATANVVIIFDSDWNPMADLQAQDRAHRIGQRSDVSVFRLITNSPVEEKILSRATEKLNMSELVVEAGKFDKSSVENDNSLERRRMMEILLSDFDATTPGAKTSEPTESEIEAPTDADDDADSQASSSDDENLNELLSNNEADFDLYTAMDHDPAYHSAGLYTKEDEIPDWIKYPDGNGKNGALTQTDYGGPRKRNEVAYDDGLTERQFVRMMDKQYDAEQADAASNKKRTAAKMKEGGDSTPGRISQSSAGPPGTMTDWTFRKLISTTKQVIALKDPTTKRRLSEIFLEKPCNQTYPDYYEIIERPIAINDILRKCRGHLYSDVKEFRDDWKLLFANCKRFNGEESWVTTDAKALERELERVMKKQGFDEPPPPPKRKPLRIKLSLKSKKKDGDAAAYSAPASAKKSKSKKI
jgi:SNF2 family DNA or RNA helicase